MSKKANREKEEATDELVEVLLSSDGRVMGVVRAMLDLSEEELAEANDLVTKFEAYQAIRGF